LIITTQQAAGEQLKEVWASAKDEDIVKQRFKCRFVVQPQSPMFSPTIPQPIVQPNNLPDDQQKENFNNIITEQTQQKLLGKAESSDDEMKESLSDTKESQFEELNTLREEYKKIVMQLANMTSEKERFRRDMEQAKEDTIRQRKMVGNKEVLPTTLATQIVEPQGLLSNRIIQFILIAVLFFLIGKLL